MVEKREYPYLILILCAFLLSACTTAAKAVQPIRGLPKGTDGYAWWNDTVFYEIFVRSFYDSNGDGIGDFNGIIQKLDYLNDGDPKKDGDLGVTGIWLMPINPAASYHGYDVTDYYTVNPEYGSIDDFKKLLNECHRRGIRVIMDLVLNHTSIKNPWFIEARDEPQSSRHDWYIWSATNPNYLGPWNEQVWYPSTAGYYYAIFWVGMPDLNYRNEDVTTEMHSVAKFWLKDVGVDGFRLDAARHLIEEGKNQADTGSTHEWWAQFRPFYKAINPEAFTIGEIWTTNYSVINYVQGDQLDMAFNFDLASQVINNVNIRNAANLGAVIQSSFKLFKPGTYATFLTNHDQRRVINAFGGDIDETKLAAMVLLTTPGSPFIYYGEEIGMSGDKPDPNIRTPMQWSTEKYAGFSSIFPWESYNSNFTQFNVATESVEPTSLLSLYRRLIDLRNDHAALRVGSYTLVRSDNPTILSFLRVSQEETLMVLINMSKKAVNGYQLSLTQSPLTGTYRVFPLLNDNAVENLIANREGGFEAYKPSLEIPANDFVILQLRGK